MMNNDNEAGIEDYIISELLEDYDPQYERAYNFLKYKWQEDRLNSYCQSLVDEIGSFQFNNEFITKIEDYIKEKKLENNKKSFLILFVEDLKDKHNKFIIKLKKIFDDNILNANKLKSFIEDAPHCIEDLTEEKQFLASELIENNKKNNLKMVLQELDLSDYKVNLLREAMKYNRLEIVEALLENNGLKYTAQDILNLHRFSEYKATTIEIINTLTEYTKDTPEYYSAVYNKAIYHEYNNQHYLDAIKSVNKIKTKLNNQYKEDVATYYQGLSYLYIGEVVSAKKSFESINITEDQINSADGYKYLSDCIKNHLVNIENKEGNNTIVVEELQKYINHLKEMPVITDNTKNLLQSILLNFKTCIEGKREKNSNIKDQLLKFKYIELKTHEPQLALILQFTEVREELLKQYYIDNINEARQALDFLNNSFNICDAGLSLLGLTPESIID